MGLDTNMTAIGAGHISDDRCPFIVFLAAQYFLQTKRGYTVVSRHFGLAKIF